MTAINHNRPRYRTEGRQTERVNGDDEAARLIASLRPVRPFVPRPSKAEQAAEAEHLVAEFNVRKSR